MSATHGAAVLAALLLAAGCAPTAEVTPTPAAAVAAVPVSSPPAAVQGRRYALQATPSEAIARVYREGALARLGHNHVLRATQLGGMAVLADDWRQSRFHIVIPLAALELDEAALRRREGGDFASELSAADIAATRANMLGEQSLRAEQFPQLTVEGGIAGGTRAAPELDAVITLAGAALRQRLPVRLQEDAAGLNVSGEMALRQSDYGITPFSALLGALRVRDVVDIVFRLRLAPLAG
jgi:polyisoprenoid-binding protein YceI